MSAWWLRLVPATFVLLWSTGFIGARLGMPHAEPMTFLALRFALTAAILLLAAAAVARSLAAAAARLGPPRRGRAADARPLPRRRVRRDPARARGGALGADRQPAAAAGGRRRAVPAGGAGRARAAGSAWAWASLGAALVLSGKLGGGGGGSSALAACVAALARHHRRHALPEAVLRRAGPAHRQPVQFAAAAAACGSAPSLFETRRVDWTPELVFALFWLVFVLSLGAIPLLYLLLRRGAAARVSSLFFLVPPTTALIAWPLFGERLGPASSPAWRWRWPGWRWSTPPTRRR